MAKSTTTASGKAPRSQKTGTSKPVKSELSQERVEDSDDDESSNDSGSESEQVETKLTNGAAKSTMGTPGSGKSVKAVESSSDSNSSSEVADSPRAKQKQTAATKAGKRQTSDSDDSDDSDTDVSSSEVSDSSDSDAEPDENTKQQARKAATPSKAVAGPRSTQAERYVPPSGYKKVEGYENDLDLDLSDMRTKELWHITLPAGLPVSQLTSIPLSALPNGGHILSHNGTDYVVSEEAQLGRKGSHAKCLLLPETSSRKFKNLSTSITRTLHVKSQIALPNLKSRQADLTTGSEAAAKTSFPTIDKTRPMPTGLKMRYRPPGFGPGKAGKIGSESSESESDSDVDMADAPTALPTFKRPKMTSSTSASTRDKKGKHVELANTLSDEKRKHDASASAPSVVEKAKEHGTSTKPEKTKKLKSETAGGTNAHGSTGATPAKSHHEPTTNGSTSKHDPSDVEMGDAAEDKGPASGKKSLSKEEQAAKLARKAERARQREEKEERKRKKAAAKASS